MTNKKKKACDGKIVYETKERAWYKARHRQKKSHIKMNAYVCPWCGGWHIGRMRREYTFDLWGNAREIAE